MTSQIDKIIKAREAVHEAKARLHSAIRCLPVGVVVSFSVADGQRCQRGEIIRHGYGDRIRIRNVKTGTEYWICSDALVRAYSKELTT